MSDLDIVVVSDLPQALVYQELGYCLVRYGRSCVIDRQPVPYGKMATFAYQSMFGIKSGCRKFVILDAPGYSAMLCFTIAALVGDLPYPLRLQAGLDDCENPAMSLDISRIAHVLDRVGDTPVGVGSCDSRCSQTVLLWKQMQAVVNSDLFYESGVRRWRTLFCEDLSPVVLASALDEERQRVSTSLRARIEHVAQDFLLVSSNVWGFDCWWKEGRVVIAYDCKLGSLTLACKDVEVCQSAFGHGGIDAVLRSLGHGWRKCSDSSVQLVMECAITSDYVRQVADTIASLLINVS